MDKLTQAGLATLQARLESDLEHLEQLQRLRDLEDDERGQLARIQADLEAVDEGFEALKRARWAEENRRREQERQRKAAREARERAQEEAQAEAVAFLESLFASSGQPVEVRAIYDAAEEEGVSQVSLLSAADELGLRSMGWLKSGTRTLIDRGKGTYWGEPSPFTGMLDAGPPSKFAPDRPAA